MRQIVSYGVIGSLSATTDAVIFWLLITYIGWPAQVANVVGVMCGMTMSFWLNRGITFRVYNRTLLRFVGFWAVGFTGLALSAAILAIGLHFSYPPMLVKVVAIVVVAMMQFLLNRTLTFRDKRVS